MVPEGGRADEPPADVAIADVGFGAAALAVDVGGTTIKSALVDAAGRVRAASRVPTPHGVDPAAAVVERIVALLTQTRRDHPDLELSALGVAIPGVVDEASGVGIHSENLGWRDAPIRRMLTDAVDVRVSLVHDVRAAGEAEMRLGAGAGHANAAVVAIGTGVSAALRVDGRLLRSRGYAGEIGHLRVGVADLPCACGGHGCLETVASAAAIERRYRALGGSTKVTGAQDVIAAAAHGDPIAHAVWEDALDGLAAGLAAIASVSAPEVIVLAGGLSDAGDLLIGPLAERLTDRLRVVPVPALVRARFGADAGTVGAALSTRDVQTARADDEAPAGTPDGTGDAT